MVSHVSTGHTRLHDFLYICQTDISGLAKVSCAYEGDI